MEDFRQLQKPLLVALDEFLHGNARPLGDDGGDLLAVDALAYERIALALRLHRLFEGLFELGELAVFDFGGLGEVVVALGALHTELRGLDFLAQNDGFLGGLLFSFPLRLHRGGIGAQLRELPADFFEALFVVVFLDEGLFLYFEAADFAQHRVEVGRHGVELGFDSRARLVHEVDCLVRKLPARDVPVAQFRCLHERPVLYVDAVERLKALFQPAQYGNGSLNVRFGDVYALEAAFERGVLFDVLPVFVEGGRAHAAQLPAREHGF